MRMLPAPALQKLQRLFDQQMWALGRDVTRPGDNLLAQRGFLRQAPAPGAATSGVWRLEEGGLRLELSSVGARLSTEGRSVYLDREPLARQLRGVDPVPLARLLRWFADYERWVEARAAGWRAQSLAQRSRPPAFAAPAMAEQWESFARQLELAAPDPPTALAE